MALTYTGSGEEGAEHLREANETLEQSPDLRADPQRALRCRAPAPVAARRPIAAARWRRGRSRRPAPPARSARSRARCGSPAAMRRPRTASRSRSPATRRAIRLSRETGQATALCAGLAGLACIEARQGHEEACRAHAQEALELAEERGLGFFALWALEALGDLELGLGHVEAAVEVLLKKERRLQERRIADPDPSPAPELIEALLRLGRDTEAARRLIDFEAIARPSASPGRWPVSRGSAGCSASRAPSSRRWRCTRRPRIASRRRARCCARARRSAVRGTASRRASRCAARSMPSTRSARPRGPSRPAPSCKPAGRPPAGATRRPSTSSRPASCRSRSSWPKATRPRGGREALPQPQDRRLPPAQRLPQAGDRFPGGPARRARPRPGPPPDASPADAAIA